MKEVNFHDFNFGTTKWNQMFHSEDELVEYVKKIDMDTYIKKSYKGCDFMAGFQKTLSLGKYLSKPQMTQLKRLSKEVYKYHKGY